MDIVERLRGDYSDERLEIAADEIERLRGIINDDRLEGAADEIEQLRGQVEFERECLNRAFAELAKKDDEIEQLREALQHLIRWHDQLSAADIAKAKAALKEKE